YTIWNDDVFSVNVSDAAVVTEPASGSVNATFTVSLNGTGTQSVYVTYSTANGTATAGSDYTARSGTLTFAPGVTSQTVTVPVLADSVYEPTDETFTLNLSSPLYVAIGRGQGVGTIHDNPPPPTLSFGTISPVTEGDNASVFATIPVL